MDEQNATTQPTRPKRKYTRRQPLKAKEAAPPPHVSTFPAPEYVPAEQYMATNQSALFSGGTVPVTPNQPSMGLPPPPPMPPRPAVRPEMRAEDPREAAARRTAEIRGHGQIAMDDDGHLFDVDPSTIPPAWHYEYKTYTVLGARDPDRETTLRLRGWTPVPAGRHPELVPIGTPPDAPIIKQGQMLMEIPAEIAMERQRAADRAARLAVAQKEAQAASTPPGTLGRTTDPRVHKINKTIGYDQPIPVTPAA